MWWRGAIAPAAAGEAAAPADKLGPGARLLKTGDHVAAAPS
jgi:hypothetical protein